MNLDFAIYCLKTTGNNGNSGCKQQLRWFLRSHCESEHWEHNWKRRSR